MGLFQRRPARAAVPGDEGGRGGPPWLVVGLGNPGAKYASTWHNAGFMALEVLSQRHGIRIDRIKFKGVYGQGAVSGAKAVLLRPGTYMNLSGESVREAMDFFKVPPARVVVLVDDVDLPRGQIRIRPAGGPGTQKGMKSVVERLGTEGFPRVRIGIGPVPERWDIADFVLSEIPASDQPLMFDAFARAADAVAAILADGTEAAMNRFNGRA
jgi:PTH1 family peptidyl-tRNA hydrolase